MAFQGVAIVAVSIGLASLLYYFFSSNGAQQQPHSYAYSDNDHNPDSGRLSNYDSWNESSNSEQLGKRRKGHSKRKHSRNIECAICLTPIENQNKTLSCHHSFHEKCIENWKCKGPMETRGKCPICRGSYADFK